MGIMNQKIAGGQPKKNKVEIHGLILYTTENVQLMQGEGSEEMIAWFI